MDHVNFIQMKDSDKEDYDFFKSHEIKYTKGTADRLLSTLIDLDKRISVYQVNRLGHSVQSATRVWRDGLILIGLYQLLCTILAIFLRLTITMNMQRQSCFPLSGNNAYGSLKNTVIFKCPITPSTSASVQASAKYPKITPIMTTMSHSANAVIKQAMIPITLANH